MGSADLDPRDFDVPGLTANVTPRAPGFFEVYWQPNMGMPVATAEVRVDGDDLEWRRLDVRTEGVGLVRMLMADVAPRLRSSAGIRRWIVPNATGRPRELFTRLGFGEDGERLVGSTAPQGSMVRTARAHP